MNEFQIFIIRWIFLLRNLLFKKIEITLHSNLNAVIIKVMEYYHTRVVFVHKIPLCIENIFACNKSNDIIYSLKVNILHGFA